MGLVDLHVHSIYSDGSNTLDEIIKMCEEKNITTVAITDHDEIQGSKLLIKNHPANLKVVSGVELTIKVSSGRFHLLGYDIDLENERLNKTIKELKETSIYNLLLYIELLKLDYGIVISQEEIDSIINKPGNIGRPDIAVLLVQKKICRTINAAFDNYLRPVYEKVSQLKKGITPLEGIALIKEAGGVPVLAHPNSLKLGLFELENLIKGLKGFGLEGIETVHINENPEQRIQFKRLAEKYKLLETGGTDYHGDVKPDVQLGSGRENNVHIEEGQLSFLRKVKTRY